MLVAQFPQGSRAAQLNMRGSVDATFRSISGTENTIRADAGVIEFAVPLAVSLWPNLPVIVHRNAGLIGSTSTEIRFPSWSAATTRWSAYKVPVV